MQLTQSKPMIKPKNIILLFISVLVFTACTKEPPVLQEKTSFKNAKWNRFKYLEYKPEINDNSTPYIFTLKLEFTKDYPYNYLKIQLDKTSSDGEEYVKIFSIPVKDQNGVFLEEEKDGIYYINMILSRQIYFSSTGKYQINIEELMPPYYLKGVKSAEFIIEKRTK